MKIVRELIRLHEDNGFRFPEMTIEGFADKHGLTMFINEREDPELPRFYASFLFDVKEDGTLHGVIGNGASETEAVRDYASKISLKTITNGKTEIRVPRLV